MNQLGNVHWPEIWRTEKDGTPFASLVFATGGGGVDTCRVLTSKLFPFLLAAAASVAHNRV